MYIRTKDGIYHSEEPIKPEKEIEITWLDSHSFMTSWKTKPHDWKQAETVEELIQVGDLIEWYSHSSKRPEYLYIQNDDELFAAQHYSVTKVFGKVGQDFKLFIFKDQGEWKSC